MNFEEQKQFLSIQGEVNELLRQEWRKEMGKATFWLVAAVVVIFMIGKISTLNTGG